jgi:hypothetical protein
MKSDSRRVTVRVRPATACSPKLENSFERTSAVRILSSVTVTILFCSCCSAVRSRERKKRPRVSLYKWIAGTKKQQTAIPRSVLSTAQLLMRVMPTSQPCWEPLARKCVSISRPTPEAIPGILRPANRTEEFKAAGPSGAAVLEARVGA